MNDEFRDRAGTGTMDRATATTVEGDALSLPFADGSFDLVFVAGHCALDLVDESHSASLLSHFRDEPGSPSLLPGRARIQKGLVL